MKVNTVFRERERQKLFHFISEKKSGKTRPRPDQHAVQGEKLGLWLQQTNK